MKTTQSIDSFVRRRGSGDEMCARPAPARHGNALHVVRLVCTIFLAAAMSSPLLAIAVDLLKTHSDFGTEAGFKRVAWTNGEIKNIDSEMGKLTIKHDPLVNLHMPAMTMLFKVHNASLCDGLHVGDKVRFAAESINGSLVITDLKKRP